MNQLHKSLAPDTPFGEWLEQLKESGKLDSIQPLLSRLQDRTVDENDPDLQELLKRLSEEQQKKQWINGLPNSVTVITGLALIGLTVYLAKKSN